MGFESFGSQILWLIKDLQSCNNYTNLFWIHWPDIHIQVYKSYKEKRRCTLQCPFPKQKLRVFTLPIQLFNPKQTSKRQISILDKVSDIQRLRTNHFLILEFLPEIKPRPSINFKSVKVDNLQRCVLNRQIIERMWFPVILLI